MNIQETSTKIRVGIFTNDYRKKSSSESVNDSLRTSKNIGSYDQEASIKPAVLIQNIPAYFHESSSSVITKEVTDGHSKCL